MLDFPYPAETWLPHIRLAIEAIRWLAWPVAALTIALIFRGPVSRMLGKVASFSMGGAKAEFLPAQISKPASLDRLSSGGANSDPVQNDVMDVSLTDAQRSVRSHFEKEIEKFPEVQRNKVLLSSVAIARLQAHFALAYANIFGSQIRALELLNQRKGVISMSEASNLFAELQKEFHEFKSWTIERYLSYLRDFGLITISSDNVAITPIGKDFILWLDTMGLAKNKNL